MYLANDGNGWPQGLLRKPMPPYPDTAELAADVGPGETSYTQYDRDITSASIEWLKEHFVSASEVPWVLFISFICPHYPLSAPEQFYEIYRDASLSSPYDCDPVTQLKQPGCDAMREFWDYDQHFTEQGRIDGLRN